MRRQWPLVAAWPAACGGLALGCGFSWRLLLGVCGVVFPGGVQFKYVGAARRLPRRSRGAKGEGVVRAKCDGEDARGQGIRNSKS